MSLMSPVTFRTPDRRVAGLLLCEWGSGDGHPGDLGQDAGTVHPLACSTCYTAVAVQPEPAWTVQLGWLT